MADTNDKNTPKNLKLESVEDLMKKKIDPTLNLVGDGHIVRGNDRIHLLAGHAGVGKSRAVTYLVKCLVTGEKWFGLDIPNKTKTLIIQTENGIRRLQEELKPHQKVLSGNLFYADVNEDINLRDSHYRERIRQTIIDKKIGLLVFDPWNQFVNDSSQKDYKPVLDMILGCLPTNPKECPAVLIVAHCRKPSNHKHRRVRGRDLMHEVSGSSILTAKARSVFVIEHLHPLDNNDARIIFTCAKSNDAKLSPRGCYQPSPDIFTQVEDFDWSEYNRGQRPGAKPKYGVEELVNLITSGEFLRNKDWLERAENVMGISVSLFNELVREAKVNKLVKLTRGKGYSNVSA